MDRRKMLEILGVTTGAVALVPREVFGHQFVVTSTVDQKEIEAAFAILRGEPVAAAEVRAERGGPRLFVNGTEVYPLMALSAETLKTAASYRASGIGILAPIVGLNWTWAAPGKYEFEKIDLFFARLLFVHPGAWFLPRLHLNVPQWWKDAHPDEMVKCGLTADPAFAKRPELLGECGLNWNGLMDAYDASYASKFYRTEMADLLKAFLRHMEESPLASRMIGYQVTGGMTGEWHYPGSRYLPDYSEPMREAVGPIPAPERRLETTAGLLRDPAKEGDVIAFYKRFHTYCSDTVLHFARVVKEQTQRRVLCGTFHTYLLENVHIQEAGHLAPERILNSKDIDFIPSPYTYQHTNKPGEERWKSDMVDDSGHWLGRARGVGGDGSYRVLLESLRRHGKLFIVEMDPSTYIEPVKRGEGGSGHETKEGSIRILQRDLAQMFARGVGGWLFDFGHLVPPFGANRGWYDDQPLIETIRPFAELGKRERPNLEISPVAQIVSVYDAKAFFATAHWKREEPWTGYGISVSDHFNHWFLNSQQRTFSRIGAPMDSVYRFDLESGDARRYRLMFMVNLFYLEKSEVSRLLELLAGSEATVVWYYAPGLIGPDRFDMAQMEKLTGMRFEILMKPGPMLIDTDIPEAALRTTFGTAKPQFPRFAVREREVTVFGTWNDGKGVAFARKKMQGWTSVYVGAAPLTVDILRWLAMQAGIELWSTKPDIVYASRDAAAVVATEPGERVLTFPAPLAPVEGGPASASHRVTMEFGDVRVFVRHT